MLVVDRQSESWSDAWVRDLPERVGEGDCLVVNNSRVLAARLVGKRRPREGGRLGGTAEILVVEPADAPAGVWRSLVRPSRKLRPGSIVETGWATIKVLGHTGDGMRLIEFPGLDGTAVTRLLASRGHVPLPPYIRRGDDHADRERYQTVFAREPGSVAAPTAGLHFDKPLLDRIRGRGARIAELTLHVGPGTFRPVSEEHVEKHRMHAERFEVPEATAEAVYGARRTIAVGTDGGARPGIGGGRRATDPPPTWQDRSLYRAGIPLPGRGRAADQFPPAPVNAADAGCGIRHQRPCTQGLRARHASAV